MSELASQDIELNSDLGVVYAAISPGALIREAREASGVHIDVLAAALKITVDRLEALESDRYAALPDIVFARALASSACRILKIDSAYVLALMPKNQAHSLPVGRADINATFKDGSEKQSQNPFLRQFTRPLGIAVIVLLLGAGVLFFLPQRGGVPEGVATAPVQALPAAEMSEGFALTQPIPLAQELESRKLIAPAASIAGDATDTRASNGSTVKAEAPAAASGDTSMAADGLLKFHAREATWVQVRDATKAVVFERTLTKGASASATGILPLSVVIGRAASTDVFVRGAPFVLTSVTKENVARFEVK